MVFHRAPANGNRRVTLWEGLIQTSCRYGREFESLLLSMVAGALSLDECIAAEDCYVLYPRTAINDAACAAKKVGLPVDQGVGYFLLCVFELLAQTSNNEPFLSSAKRISLSIRRETSSKLSTIIDYAIPILLDEKGLDRDLFREFVHKYADLANKQY
jgi:hypothetical protein